MAKEFGIALTNESAKELISSPDWSRIRPDIFDNTEKYTKQAISGILNQYSFFMYDYFVSLTK